MLLTRPTYLLSEFESLTDIYILRLLMNYIMSFDYVMNLHFRFSDGNLEKRISKGGGPRG